MGEGTPENIMDILVVEDNPDDIALIKHSLNKNPLITHIEVVHDGQSALDFVFCTGAYQHRTLEPAPKLILLDLKIPKVSGREVLKILKSYVRTQVIPVVIISGSMDDSDILQMYQLGANSFILKTDNFAKLVEHTAFYWLAINTQAGNQEKPKKSTHVAES